MNAPSGVEVKPLDTGATYAKVHHYADPSKDEAWLDAIRLENLRTPRQFEVEYLMKELFLEGLPVFGGFVEELHAPIRLASVKLPVLPYSKFFGGWDVGNTNHPAFLLLQVSPQPNRIITPLGEVVGEPGTWMVEFAPAVINWISLEFPQIPLAGIIHGGDESGATKNGVTGVSAFEVASDHGLVLNPVANQWAKRRGAVDRLLAGRIDDTTASFFYSQKMNPWIHKGFLGGYRLKQVTQGANAQYGEPVKDAYSHPHDALQYAAVVAGEFMDGAEVTRIRRGAQRHGRHDHRRGRD